MADSVWLTDGGLIYQADEYAGWDWQQGDPGHYWGYAVLPAYDNVSVCEITRLWFTTDNAGNITAHFTVHAKWEDRSPGVELSFKAIRCP